MAKFKKLAIISSAVLMTTAFAFGVAACEKACEHTYEKKSDETHTWYACTQEGCDSVVGKEEIVTPHVHTFTLQKNDSKHWYECSDESCTEKVGEADHVWNEGEETLAPEVGVAGEYTYTCLVCEQTDVEAVSALTPNPLLVAEGSGSVTNAYDSVEDMTTWGTANIQVPMTAGSYIISVSAPNIDPNAFVSYVINDNWNPSLQFDVEEDGNVDFTIQVISSSYNNTSVNFNYTIKKVPSITPDVSEMEGTAEIVTYAWVKVNVTIPVAGKFAIGSEDALFSETADGSESDFIYDFTTTEANETVTFYAKALDDSDEKAMVTYAVAMLEATELSKGANTVYLWGFTGTDVTFTAPAAGKYKFVTFDETFAVYTNYEGGELCSKLNGIVCFEAEEAGQEISFAVTGLYDVATFAIVELTDEEITSSSVSLELETGETVATTTATLAQGANLINLQNLTPGLYQLSWTNQSIYLDINGVESWTNSVVFSYVPRMNWTYTLISYNYENTEDTFTLTAIDGTNNQISASTEIFVPDGINMPYMELPVKLDAGNYSMSINSDNATFIWGFDFNEGTGTATLTNEPAIVAATGEFETLYVSGSMEAEMVTLTISGGDEPVSGNGTGEYGNPYVLPATGGSFSDLTLHQNPRSGVYYAYFSFTAEQDGVLTVTEITVSEITAGVSPMQPTNEITVSAGVEYTILVTTDAMASTASPVFTFTANA